MKYILLSLINIYQSIPGPWHDMCRHTPSCSNYMKDAIIEYGSVKGTYLGIKRILRCNPWGTSGYDPVPRKGEKL